MTTETFLNGRITLRCGDSRDVLKTLADNSIDSIVCDPPYALVSIVKRFGAGNAAAVKVPEGGSGAYARASAGFMGKAWDTGETAFAVEFWAECLRVLKPGGHVVAFSGTRTYHRMACAIEDAGFEVRDMLSWLYGSGFPKSHDVSKGIDKAAGAQREILVERTLNNNRFATSGSGNEQEQFRKFSGNANITAASTELAREWAGWGTALKPACEPICFGRKPLIGTVATNVLLHGTGAINIDGCRVETEDRIIATRNVALGSSGSGVYGGAAVPGVYQQKPEGRWPANIIHDGSDEVVAAFPLSDSGIGSASGSASGGIWSPSTGKPAGPTYGDGSGSAARFFYTAKADSNDRAGSKHPTVKPVSLMQWLCRLVTPPGGTVLDPFAGTGTTGEAAFREGFNAILIEREEEYQADIRRRMALCMAGPDERARESIKARTAGQPVDAGPLFASEVAP